MSLLRSRDGIEKPLAAAGAKPQTQQPGRRWRRRISEVMSKGKWCPEEASKAGLISEHICSFFSLNHMDVGTSPKHS
jgi:hypothetical protein